MFPCQCRSGSTISELNLIFSESLPSDSSVIDTIMNATTTFAITSVSGKQGRKKLSFKLLNCKKWIVSQNKL